MRELFERLRAVEELLAEVDFDQRTDDLLLDALTLESRNMDFRLWLMGESDADRRVTIVSTSLH